MTWACRAWMVLGAFAVSSVLLIQPVAGQQESASEKPSTAKSAETTKPLRGRLPAYFSKIVSEEQRQKIYAIQKEFQTKIRAIQLQLATLKKDRDQEIDSVLTPTQRDQIAAIKAAAKEKRKKAKVEKPSEP